MLDRDVVERCYNYFKKHSHELCSSSDRVYALYFPGWIKSYEEKAAKAKAYKAAQDKAAKLKAAKEEAAKQKAGQANAGKNKTNKGKSSGTDKQQNPVPEHPPSPTIAAIHDWNMEHYEAMWEGLSPNARGWIVHDVFLFGPKTNSLQVGWHSGKGWTLPRDSAKVLFLHVISSANPKRDGAIHMFASYGNAFKEARNKEGIHTNLQPWHDWSPQAQTPRDADPLVNMDEALKPEGMLQLLGQSEIDWTKYPPSKFNVYLFCATPEIDQDQSR